MNKVFAFILALAGIAVFITLFILGMVLFSYLILIGAVIALVLFAVGYIRSRFFNQPDPFQSEKLSEKGRIIEQEPSSSSSRPDDKD